MSEAEEITRALGGTWYGRYGVAFCPAHENTRTPALRLGIGEGGKLLLNCSAGCSFCEVLGALKARGLVKARFKGSQDRPAVTRPKRGVSNGARKMEIALRIWREANPVEGALSARYLARRRIAAPYPVTLRHHPALWHPGLRRKIPGMVAAITLPHAGLVAIHRTWLEEPGRKCAAGPQRAMLGPAAGGAVRIRKGSGRLIVAEGIENAMSVRDLRARPGDSVWAALTSTGMMRLTLPKEPGELLIAPDWDEAGVRGMVRLWRRARDAGWKVGLLKPPGPGVDWNDLAMERKNAR